MIAKKYRLTQKEVRKVFRKKKPFFSYMLLANVSKNTLGHARFGILLSKKVTHGSVNRNFFRRRFYENTGEISSYGYDVVVIPKKGTVLQYKDPAQVADFIQDLDRLYKNIIKHPF